MRRSAAATLWWTRSLPTPPPSRRRLWRGLARAAARAAAKALFQGFLRLRPRCEHCGLDFSFADSADGPAFFVMFFAGFIVAGSALAVEMLYPPPYWVHALLWAPLILITTLVPLRPMKGLLIALQYHHKAAEGRSRPAMRREPLAVRQRLDRARSCRAVRACRARHLRRRSAPGSSSARRGRKR